MNEPELRARLKRAELRLGDAAQTVPIFSSEKLPTARSCIKRSRLLHERARQVCFPEAALFQLLPRVVMYFDDLFGNSYTTVSGEWAVINEFNSAEIHRRLGSIYGLECTLRSSYWFAN